MNRNSPSFGEQAIKYEPQIRLRFQVSLKEWSVVLVCCYASRKQKRINLVWIESKVRTIPRNYPDTLIGIIPDTIIGSAC
ncbi:hypothetical protein CEXT_465361 [Caerostris extrusa]|uniref:Uncharacterized protein n=1 Tax=Caerostris extrusa TaxID=172846 RepID=A0AAV4PMC9_CAEEX|nr:hypothetical protein CEXT_465361 [Caerostris extrusa]